MKSVQCLLASAGLMLGLCLPTVASADCVDGVRAISDAEREFTERATAALLSLLPAPPPDTAWRGSPPDPRQPARLPSFCKGTAIGQFEVSVGAAYLFNWPKSEADRRALERRALLDQIQALEKLPPEQEARHRELTERAREAYGSQPKARRGGPPLSESDQRLADQKVAEGKALTEQAAALQRGHQARVQPQVAALQAQAEALRNYPQELQVGLRINGRRFEPAGANEQRRDHGTPRGAGLLVHNVSLLVTGPEGAPRQRLWEAVDGARLQALVGAPLPPVAESQARAAARLAGAAPGVAAPAVDVPAAQAAPPAAASAPARVAEAPAATAPVVQQAARAAEKLKGLLGR